MCFNLSYNWVKFLFLHNFCKETRHFLEKFTQLKRILHDRRLRQISSLCGYCSDGLIFLPALEEFLYILQYNLPPHIWLWLEWTYPLQLPQVLYNHWPRFDTLVTGTNLVAPAAHVWAPHRQRRQEWARRRWPRGPVWPFCHWRLALCIRFDCLEAEKSGTPELQVSTLSVHSYKQTMNKIAKKYLVVVVCQAPHLEMGSLPKVSS